MPGTKRDRPVPGVYADIEELIRLQYKARGFSFLPRQPIHSLLSGRYASRVRGRGLNFEEIRRYLPGDDIRNVDWKVTARMQKPHVRVYTEERDRPVLLVVDQRMSMFFGSRVNMNSVVAAELASLAAWRAVSVGDRVGAVVFNDTEIQEITPHRSRRTVMRILGEVVRQNHTLNAGGPAASREMLNQVLGKVLQRVSHDYLICIFSTLYGDDAETGRLITRLAQHNDVLVGLIYDELQVNLPERGRLVVSDGDLQLEMDTGDTKRTSGISEFFNERLRETKDRLKRIGVPVLLLSNAKDPVDQVRAQLGYAGARSRG